MSEFIKRKYFFLVFVFFKRLLIYSSILIVYLQTLDFSFVQIQIIRSTFFFSILISEIPTGLVSDYFSHKFSLLVSSILSMAGITTIFLFNTFPIIVLSIVFTGLSFSFQSGSLSAYYYELIDEGNRLYSDEYPIFYRITITSALSSALLCSVITKYLSMEMTFFFSIISSVIALFLSFFLPDLLSKDNKKRKFGVREYYRSFNECLKIKKLQKVIVGSIVIGSLMHIVFDFSIYIMNASDIPKSFFGFFTMMINILCLLLIPMVLNMNIKMFSKYFTEIILFIIIISCSVLSYKLNKIVSVFFILILHLSYELYSSVIDIRINELVNGDIRASFLSVVSFLLSFLFVVVSPIFGIIADLTNVLIVFKILTTLFGLLLILAIFSLILKRNKLEVLKP